MPEISARKSNKRKTTCTDDIDLTLSDLEDNRLPVKYTVEKLSKDQCRVLQLQAGQLSVLSESEGQSDHGTSSASATAPEFHWDLGDIDIDAVTAPTSSTQRRKESSKRWYVSSDQPLKNWIPLRDEYLDELIQSEGRAGDTTGACKTCELKTAALYRCRDCFAPQLQCPSCIVNAHAHNPFHRIEHWNGKYFARCALGSLGLRIQLGHPTGQQCASPQPARKKMAVIHTNGIHQVAIDYCGCDRSVTAGNIRQQLLWYRLYPATDQSPMTCTTFSALEAVHLQNVQLKSGIYDLYMAIERLTDNTGLVDVRDCYKAFLRTVREWKHLKMLKRAGRGHDPTGVNGTKQGELTVRCLSCPWVGINMPENWRELPPILRRMFFSIDACFRLKRYNISNEEKDPVIDSGWSYFVEDKAYKEQVKKYKGQKSMPTCNGLAAVEQVDSKFSAGYAATGIIACIDARHEFMLPNGAGDTQGGERQINSDWVYACARRFFPYVDPETLYDIVCQWVVHLQERLDELPPDLRFEAPPLSSLQYGIGKLHWHGHKPEDHSQYSLNYKPNNGRTDGEGVERGWWDIQPIAASTKMMGPGSRQLVLNDAWNYSNHRRHVKLVLMLCRKFAQAKQNAADQRADFDAQTAALDPATHAEWEKMVTTWEKDPTSSPDPYMNEHAAPSETDIERRLAKEEEEAARSGTRIPLHDVSPSAFISIGLDLEDQQRQLRSLAERGSLSNEAKIFNARTALLRRITNWRRIQAVYMSVQSLLSEDGPARDDEPPCERDTSKDSGPAVETSAGATSKKSKSSTAGQMVENTCLWLPSDVLKLNRENPDPKHPLDADQRRALAEQRQAALRSLKDGIVQAEFQLRQAQCTDALDALRTKIYMKTRLLQYKRLNVRHQAANTRAQTALNTVQAKINLQAAKYRRARDALVSIVGSHDEWSQKYERDYPPLLKDDLRGLEDDDPATARKKKRRRKDGPAEGSRLVSWIWRGADHGAEAGNMHTSVRIEWMKARARALRWEEELVLISEEIRRYIVYMEWHAGWWDEHSDPRQDVTAEMREGLGAYAARQAAMLRGLGTQGAALWKKTLTSNGVEDESVDRGNVADDDDADDAGVEEIEESEDVIEFLELDVSEFS